jgi:hypothetical protein
MSLQRHLFFPYVFKNKERNVLSSHTKKNKKKKKKKKGTYNMTYLSVDYNKYYTLSQENNLSNLYDLISSALSNRLLLQQKVVKLVKAELPEHLYLAKVQNKEFDEEALRKKGLTSQGLYTFRFLLKHLLPRKKGRYFEISGLKHKGKLTETYLKQHYNCRSQEFYNRYLPQLEKAGLIKVTRNRIWGNTYCLQTKRILQFLPSEDYVTCYSRDRKGKAMTISTMRKTKTGKEKVTTALRRAVKDSATRRKNGKPLELSQPVKQMLDYWNSKEELSNYKTDTHALLHPSKRLKEAIRILQQFRSGHLFMEEAFLPPDQLKDFDKSKKRTVADFCLAVDSLVKLKTDPKSPIKNSTFIKKLSIGDFLVGVKYPERQAPLYLQYCLTDWEKDIPEKVDARFESLFVNAVSSYFPQLIETENTQHMEIINMCCGNIEKHFEEKIHIYSHEFDSPLEFVLRRVLPRMLGEMKGSSLNIFLFKGRNFPEMLHRKLSFYIKKGSFIGEIYLKE